MIVGLVSIMHSGTRLMLKALLDAGFVRMNMIEPKRGFNSSMNGIMQTHASSSGLLKGLEHIGNKPIVVPMRHPARILKSFTKNNRTHESYLDQWCNLEKYVMPLNPMFIHIDQVHIRDAEFNLVCDRIGIPLKTDWPVTEETCNNFDAYTDIDTSLMCRIPNSIMATYKSTFHG